MTPYVEVVAAIDDVPLRRQLFELAFEAVLSHARLGEICTAWWEVPQGGDYPRLVQIADRLYQKQEERRRADLRGVARAVTRIRSIPAAGLLCGLSFRQLEHVEILRTLGPFSPYVNIFDEEDDPEERGVQPILRSSDYATDLTALVAKEKVDSIENWIRDKGIEPGLVRFRVL